jgi:hypothetical protein
MSEHLADHLTGSGPTALAYGFSIARPFEDGIDPTAKRFVDDIGQALCGDRFQVAARIGSTIETDRPYFVPIFPVLAEQRAIRVRFYVTAERDPRYIDDPGSTEIGVLEADISDTVGRPAPERGVGLSVYFEQKVLRAAALVLSIGTKVEIRLELRSG